MTQFVYEIKSPLGIHARPAGMISKIAREAKSMCTLTRGANSTDLRNVIQLMAMGVKCGERVCIEVSGEDEQIISARLQELFESVL